MNGAAPAPTSPPAGTERRSRLRQYQVQLLERMQAAKNGAAIAERELGVSIGGRLYLLELTQISEIVTAPAITPVPLARDWYRGLVNIRGELTGVVDLGRYLAQAQAETQPPAHGQAAGEGALPQRRLITLAPALGFNCALAAERVLGLRTMAEMRVVAAPAHAAPWCERQVDDAEGQRWIRADLARLVREPRFLQVGW